MAVQRAYFVLAFLLLATTCPAAQVSAGTILPARLSSTLNTRKSKVGDRISARIMQDVSLGESSLEPGRRNAHKVGAGKIPAGARLVGEIIEVQPDRVSWKLDRLVVHGKSVPIRTSLRALASLMEIDYAQLPTNDAGGDRGSTELDWNTVQVGGDVVYGRRGGVVMHDDEVVGHSVFGDGVLLTPVAEQNGPCRGSVGAQRPQAFWLFSASACGLYGYPNVQIAHAGRSTPVGVMTLTSQRKVRIVAGSGILLRVE